MAKKKKERREAREVVAFITPEVALGDELRTFSGGLGVFTAAMLESAQRLNLPLVGATILPREGYYDQVLDYERVEMRAEYVKRYYEGILEDTGLIFPIKIDGADVYIKVWRPRRELYRNFATIYFLDTDIVENASHLSRQNTMQLYGGSFASSGISREDMEKRKIAQSIVLGRGGVEAIRLMGNIIRLCHINESHSAFAAVELLASNDFPERSEEEVIARTRRQIVFTTHTPVQAGNPEYSAETVRRMCGFRGKLGNMVMRFGGSPFNMAALALSLSSKANAVSRKHLGVAKQMWNHLPGCPDLTYITNGASRDFWQMPDMRDIRSAELLRNAKRRHKFNMLEWLQLETGHSLSPGAMTVVWARRFAEYKRPKLLFRDMEWLREQFNARQKLQVIVAGKPHPDDTEMVKAWNELYALSRQIPELVVLAGYNLEMSRILKAGADLWLNTPRAPNEACGTSGMSAAMNGAVNMSTPDGWMAEADKRNFFLFGSDCARPNQDDYDLPELRHAMKQAKELFYLRHEEWEQMMLNGKFEAESHWSADRMAQEYAEKMYGIKI